MISVRAKQTQPPDTTAGKNTKYTYHINTQAETSNHEYDI